VHKIKHLIHLVQPVEHKGQPHIMISLKAILLLSSQIGLMFRKVKKTGLHYSMKRENSTRNNKGSVQRALNVNSLRNKRNFSSHLSVLSHESWPLLLMEMMKLDLVSKLQHLSVFINIQEGNLITL
jgi:hypothetical protein